MKPALKEQLGRELFEMINPKESWLHQSPMVVRAYVSAAVTIYLKGAIS